jgi:ABC-2 type transport system ATP-binding protein
MLSVEHVSLRYQRPPRLLRPLVRVASKEPHDALRDVSLDAQSGEIVGLLGPNGAGKTTLIKIIATLLDPTSGHVLVDGCDTLRNAHDVRSRIGLVLAEDRGLYWRLTGRQNLELFGRLSGLPRADARARASELLERMGLADRDRLVFGYSSGMKMRLSLARALAARAPLVVLDEPTRSLDPIATVETHESIRALTADGHTVLLASHRIDEIVGLCDRVVVLVGGTVRYFGPPSDLGASENASLAELLATEARR